MYQLKIKICVDNEIWGTIYLSGMILGCKSKSLSSKSPFTNTKGAGDLNKSHTKIIKVPSINLDKYLLFFLINEFNISNFYKQQFISNYNKYKRKNQKTNLVKANLYPSKKEFIDFKWNELLFISALERREIDHTMSWFSTLGGAFSALGDYYENCAEIAGKISIHQFTLALRLGDPLTVARCKLYLSLSLIQRRYFKLAKFIILQQYHLAKTNSVIDHRLINMCKGIWSKLKFEISASKQGKLSKKLNNLKINLKQNK